jgi:sterol desaturase/sphingolipid hydroxylase (fatty acid hydroxylase superfamily)
MIDAVVIIRLSIFIGLLGFFVIAESLYPRRKQKIDRKTRWCRNISLVIINSLMLKFIVPISAASISLINNEYAFLNYINLPYFIIVILSVVLLDLVIYFQHWIVHRVPIFWRFHKIHHIDQELDTSSGIRFHPVEIAFSMFIKCIIVWIIGIPFEAVLVFEIILNATSLFNHANLYIPIKIDKLLRLFIVTPDMHRIHHSQIERETNSNYGFNLSCWDKLFGTYNEVSSKDQSKIDIGLEDYKDYSKTSLLDILIIPFRR